MENSKHIYRRIAPIKESFALGYSIWIVSLMESVRKAGTQVTVTELEEKCGWSTITGWNLKETQAILEMVDSKGILTVDRHMNPWILKAKNSADCMWQRIYDDLI